MNLILVILAGLTVGAAVAAMTLRNLVHCALSATVSLIGLALLYLSLGAEFAGFVQILVYVGAVAILIVFVVLLTRSGEAPAGRIAYGPVSGVLVAVAVFATLARAIGRSPALRELAATAGPGPVPALPVKVIGEHLVTDYVLPLQVLALVLTAALIGAVVIALREPGGGPAPAPTEPPTRSPQ